MEQRIVEFIRGLRAAGVRVSLAESVDALSAVSAMGIQDKSLFKNLLKATLIKQVIDHDAFNQLFPIYFGSGGPPMENALDELTSDEQSMLQDAMSDMSERMQQLLDWLTSGEGPTKEELEEMARRAGVNWARNQQDAKFVSQRVLNQMGMGDLPEIMQELREKLEAMGMSREAINNLLGIVEVNAEGLQEQVAAQIGQQVAEQRAKRAGDIHGSDLINKPFTALKDGEVEELRKELKRMASQIKSRAALRQRRGKSGKFDAKTTIRRSQKYGGVPLELSFKQKKFKPSLVLICDVSQSMWSVLEFMLYLMFELHDNVSKVRSFAFYHDLKEVSLDMATAQREPEKAVRQVLQSMRGFNYGTDLGNSLSTFDRHHMDAISNHSTVLFIGDGRNNYNDPRLDVAKEIKRRAKQVIWFNPEHRRQWYEGDSDMLLYEQHADGVHLVRNLAQLSAAVDKLLANG